MIIPEQLAIVSAVLSAFTAYLSLGVTQMSLLNRKSYYTTRAQQSRELANRAISPPIAAIHLELAEKYDMLAARPEAIDQNIFIESESNEGLAFSLAMDDPERGVTQ
jgi:hypothetical protein